jgi:histidinol dehydrogenase
MKIYFENTLTQAQRYNLLQRPSPYNQIVENVIKDLCLDVKRRGDIALREYTKRFDKIDLQLLQILKEEFLEAKNLVQPEFISALRVAFDNISKFHEQQRCSTSRISTMEGIVCWRESRPIESVGLYVPAGTAPLPSTVLMLGIPAKLAKCPRIVLCSPPTIKGSIDPSILVASEIIGINEVYKIGGAQAIAAMAYGTQTIPRVDKIFGPGNRYVTAAKQFVSKDSDGAVIDLIAGPSEVLIIADETANADVVAYDLISQAEHDPDAQSVLVTTSELLAKKVMQSVSIRAKEFQRYEIIKTSLERSFIFVTNSLESSVQFSNEYAPEHLIINARDAESLVPLIKNAGSVFIGPFAPVTAGDYASGTNHTLPTNGTARCMSGVSLDSFQKKLTFQLITKSGLESLAPTLNAFSEVEGLPAHARAVSSRLSTSKK